jgi:hypothetical protein
MFIEIGADLECMQVSAKSTDEVENLCIFHTLELAHASWDTFTACLQYNCMHLRELELMCSMTKDECKEAEAFMKTAEWQIGKIKHILNHEGDNGLNELGPFKPFEKEVSGTASDDVCLNPPVCSSSPLSYCNYESS